MEEQITSVVSTSLELRADLKDRVDALRGVSGSSRGNLSRDEAINQLIEFALPYVERLQGAHFVFKQPESPTMTELFSKKKKS